MVLATFRANGLLLAAGDALAAHDGLTSARWQVLGAVEMAGQPLTVPQIARRMGLARQSVDATVNALVAYGLLERARNLDHRRSALVPATPRGDEVYLSLQKRQAAWVDELAAGLSSADLSDRARPRRAVQPARRRRSAVHLTTTRRDAAPTSRRRSTPSHERAVPWASSWSRWTSASRSCRSSTATPDPSRSSTGSTSGTPRFVRAAGGVG